MSLKTYRKHQLICGWGGGIIKRNYVRVLFTNHVMCAANQSAYICS